MENTLPKSLFEAIRYFADTDVCVDFLPSMRWPDGPTCPHCAGKKVSYLSTRRIWKCMAKDCHKQFSVKTGTIFEDSPISLDKWLTTVWLVVNCKNGISSYEIARDVQVTQKSAWFMLHRIRLALTSGDWGKMGGNEGGPIEVDETFVGPNPSKMHGDKRARRQLATRAKMGVPVMGMLDRDARQVRAQVFPT
jgi:transposase-like protein